MKPKLNKFYYTDHTGHQYGIEIDTWAVYQFCRFDNKPYKVGDKLNRRRKYCSRSCRDKAFYARQKASGLLKLKKNED